MIVFLNGRFVPEAQAAVPITDRGFLYGDGLFETLRISHGLPLWWSRHLARLQRGAEFLQIVLPWAAEDLRKSAVKLIEQNTMPEAGLRITLTRGSGSRGYSPKGANNPTLAMTLHPMQPIRSPLRLATSSLRVPVNHPLASFKTANKLLHVLARAEVEARGADEALLLNTEGHVAEATASNLFWLSDGAVCTPPVADGALAGVAREVVLEICRARNIPAREPHLKPEDLFRADGVFLTNSVAGIVPAWELDGASLNQSPFIAEFRQWYEQDSVREGEAPAEP
jgi:branched-chain amino acid aminotransferase